MSENLGFLTVIDQSPGGLTGGYLVLNRAGRPMEFHCTMPLTPDKIQQILYGDSLQPFLCGERIAQTLIQRSKTPVLTVLTNQAAVLPVLPLVSTPIIYVFEEFAKPQVSLAKNSLFENRPNDTESSPAALEISEELSESLKHFGINNANLRTRALDPDEQSQIPRVPGFCTDNWQKIRIGNRLIAVPDAEETAREGVIAEIKDVARTIDLLEPFARIRRALDEAS